ncbi:MAG: hypothetical protein ACTHJ7_04745 [Candidatus Nitrosocosmicus sp.]
MNTRNFLYNICQKALEIDNSIEFVGVVNVNGKLIAGTNMQQQYDQQNIILDKDFFKSQLRPLTYNTLVNDSYDSSLQMNHNNAVFHSTLHEEVSDFQLICVGKSAFIVFTPLTEEQNEFLCVYFRLYGSINDLVLKLNTVFEYNE